MTIVQKIVKAATLPPYWRKDFPDPESLVRIEIREVDGELEATKTLEDVMNLVSNRAGQRGLTPGVLQDILNER
jgi:hypothetical protein